MIIFDSTRPNVKPARPFATGLAPARRDRFAPSDADRAWAAYELNKDCTDYAVIEPARAWDQEAGEAEAQARLDAGISLF